MTKLGIGLLTAAAVIAVVFTAIFGTRFFTELSSWLLIAAGLGLTGGLMLMLGRPVQTPESGLS